MTNPQRASSDASSPNREARRHPHRAPLDTAGAAEYLGTTSRHVKRLVAERRVPFLKLAGYKLRFEPDALDEWLAAQRIAAEA